MVKMISPTIMVDVSSSVFTCNTFLGVIQAVSYSNIWTISFVIRFCIAEAYGGVGLYLSMSNMCCIFMYFNGLYFCE